MNEMYASEADFKSFQVWKQTGQEVDLTSQACRPGEGGTGGAAASCWLDRHREQLLSQDTDPDHTQTFLRPKHTTSLPWPEKRNNIGRRKNPPKKKVKSAAFIAIKKVICTDTVIKLHYYLCYKNITNTTRLQRECWGSIWAGDNFWKFTLIMLVFGQNGASVHPV